VSEVEGETVNLKAENVPTLAMVKIWSLLGAALEHIAIRIRSRQWRNKTIIEKPKI
jgi:hypothetical protein